ncbi:MAG: hypothetical protein B7Z73_13055 [Planctomycetia bacterium 21-64-5]|nr:MAG: hypothetical protein B7Z73_13055 [Planctomycetia bacterium 21-64-5]
MGLDAPGPGNAAFQAILSLDDHLVGGDFCSRLTPKPSGPRNCDQSAAWVVATRSVTFTARRWQAVRIIEWFLV